jgi:O-antigen ligase
MMKEVEPKSPDNFRIWSYPVFYLALGYVWLEFSNPVLAIELQIVTRIPNSALAICLCWLTMPRHLKSIRITDNPVKWAVPFLLIATINIPFVVLEQDRTIIELISTWFWVLMLTPIIIRVLSTESGREHFLWFYVAGVSILCLLFLRATMLGLYDFGRYEFSHTTIAGPLISAVPLLLGYVFLKHGFARLILIALGIVFLIVSIPLGSRATWLIIPLEIILMSIYLPKERVLLAGFLVVCCFFVFLSFLSLEQVYSLPVIEKMDKGWKKTVQWEEDSTIWKRVGMIEKTRMILQDRPLLGVGYSNRSFASFDAGDFYIFDRLAAARRIEAHNTYLNILGGTGILGFFAFLYYLIKVYGVYRRIPRSIWRRLDCSSFIVVIIGNFIFYLSNTTNFFEIVRITSFIVAISLFSQRKSTEQEGLPCNEGTRNH